MKVSSASSSAEPIATDNSDFSRFSDKGVSDLRSSGEGGMGVMVMSVRSEQLKVRREQDLYELLEACYKTLCFDPPGMTMRSRSWEAGRT